MHARNYMFPLWFLALAFPSLGSNCHGRTTSESPGIPPVSFRRFENNVSISENSEAVTVLKVTEHSEGVHCPPSFVF